MRLVSARRALLLFIVLVGGTPRQSRAQDGRPAPDLRASDEVAVRAVVDQYFQGHATGDGAHFRRAFHPASSLYWVRADTLATRTAEQYIGGASGRPPADEAQRRRRIAFVDITGTAAVAKVELDYPTVRFVDYLSLLKVGGEWKVIAKTFNVEPK